MMHTSNYFCRLLLREQALYSMTMKVRFMPGRFQNAFDLVIAPQPSDPVEV